MGSVDEPVTVQSYDGSWPRHYQEHAALIRNAIGEDVVAVEHIGSTAVRGMTAKPIVDIMVGVVDAGASERVAAMFIKLGYEDCGGASGRRYLRLRQGQAFNVQIIEYESEMWRANIVLRDYLRSNADAARRYGEAKRAAVRRAPTLLAYSELKRRTIEDLLRKASVQTEC
jgi:GrpB-like predicted nucleotidyltransferase (UPF0157 family)